jgi:hypothetical protein
MFDINSKILTEYVTTFITQIEARTNLVALAYCLFHVDHQSIGLIKSSKELRINTPAAAAVCLSATAAIHQS